MRIVLFHWNTAEARERAASLQAAKHLVTVFSDGMKLSMKDIDAAEPEAIVIDLRRLPSHGRTLAMSLRNRVATRSVPLVFVEGDEGKTARIREEFHDATFTPWARIGTALRTAIAQPVAAPVVPRSTSGYSGKPLVDKLGVKPSTALLLLGEPEGFASTLGTLPKDVVVRRRAGTPAQVVVQFVCSRSELEKRLPVALRSLADKGALWVAWPKKTSPLALDLAEDGVRECAFAVGLVDVKVCAIDADWSGLCLRRRAAKPR